MASPFQAALAYKKRVELFEQRFARARAKKRYRTMACLLRYFSLTHGSLADVFYSQLTPDEQQLVRDHT